MLSDSVAPIVQHPAVLIFRRLPSPASTKFLAAVCSPRIAFIWPFHLVSETLFFFLSSLRSGPVSPPLFFTRDGNLFPPLVLSPLLLLKQTQPGVLLDEFYLGDSPNNSVPSAFSRSPRVLPSLGLPSCLHLFSPPPPAGPAMSVLRTSPPCNPSSAISHSSHRFPRCAGTLLCYSRAAIFFR